MKITVSLALLLAQIFLCGQTSHAQDKIRLGSLLYHLAFYLLS
jgi:hypothetical protein